MIPGASGYRFWASRVQGTLFCRRTDYTGQAMQPRERKLFTEYQAKHIPRPSTRLGTLSVPRVIAALRQRVSPCSRHRDCAFLPILRDFDAEFPCPRHTTANLIAGISPGLNDYRMLHTQPSTHHTSIFQRCAALRVFHKSGIPTLRVPYGIYQRTKDKRVGLGSLLTGRFFSRFEESSRIAAFFFAFRGKVLHRRRTSGRRKV